MKVDYTLDSEARVSSDRGYRQEVAENGSKVLGANRLDFDVMGSASGETPSECRDRIARNLGCYGD